jgi:branched-chain amino acid aminotransferase
MKPLPNFDQLTFNLTETDWIYYAYGDTRRNPVWDAGEWCEFRSTPISPSAPALAYGFGVFEGLKAHRTRDGRILLFRPDRNAVRFQKSAERITLAPFPPERFVDACVELVARNSRFVPPNDKGSFYLRPVEWGSGARLGLGTVQEFQVVFYGSPVGGYFAAGSAPGLRLLVREQGRVAPGGTGWAKAAANYAGGILIADQAKKLGFTDVLYLDARHVRYLTETSGSNVFCVLRNGTIVTPPLDDQILPGVTRDSTLHVARHLGMKVEERLLPIEEVLADGVGLFATGTAYTLARIHEITYRDRPYVFPDDSVRAKLFEVVRGIQIGEREDTWGWTREVPAR